MRRHFPVQLADVVLLVCMLVTFGERFWAVRHTYGTPDFAMDKLLMTSC